MKQISIKFPIYYYKCHDGISAYLKGYSSSPFGWEYGFDDTWTRNPIIQLRLGKLMLFYFEKFPLGFEIHLMGFWWIK